MVGIKSMCFRWTVHSLDGSKLYKCHLIKAISEGKDRFLDHYLCRGHVSLRGTKFVWFWKLFGDYPAILKISKGRSGAVSCQIKQLPCDVPKSGAETLTERPFLPWVKVQETTTKKPSRNRVQVQKTWKKSGEEKRTEGRSFFLITASRTSLFVFVYFVETLIGW